MSKAGTELRRGFSVCRAAMLMISAGLLFGCMTAEGAPSAESKEGPLKIIRAELSGLNARGVDAGEYVFGDPGEWEDFWRKHGGGPAPEIDFEKYSLVAVFLGQKPNPGYSVGIVDAGESEGEVVVEIVEYLPSPGMMYAQVIVYPFDAALVPRTDGSIRYVTTKKTGRPRANP